MNIKEIKAVADKLMTKVNEQRKALADKIAASEAHLVASTEQANKAYKAQDDKLYHNAQDAIRTAKDSIELFSRQLSDFDNKSHISKAEYEAYKADIFAELDNLAETSEAHLVALIDEIVASVYNVRSAVTDANELLNQLQIRLYHDSKYYGTPEPIRHSAEDKYKNLGYGYLVDYLTNLQFYKDAKQIEAEPAKIWGAK